jgi:hypothetical protein
MRPALGADAGQMPRRLKLGEGWEELVLRQRQVASRDQALAHGWTVEAISHRLATRQWLALLPSVYLLQSGAPSNWQRRMAALLYVGPNGGLDGADACAIWGVGLALPRGDRVDVFDRWGGSARSRGEIQVRRSRRSATLESIDGLAVVDLATALVVQARRVSRASDAIALLSFGLQQRGVTTSELFIANFCAGPKGRPRVDGFIVQLTSGARYVGELDFLKLSATSRILPVPEPNVWVRLPNGVVRCLDALYRDAALVHETLGRRVHEREDLLGDTTARAGELEEFGLHVLGNLPARIRDEGPAVLRQVEAVYLDRRGRGLPPGVEILPGPPWQLRQRRGA